MDSSCVAGSIDGRSFTFSASQSPAVPGDLVVLRTEQDDLVLGQLLDTQASSTSVVGRGAIVGRVDDSGGVEPGPVDPFGRASLDVANREMWVALESRLSADMLVGTSRTGPARLSSSSFNRHTFLCGQSGSGKSYAMGVLLEQLLIDTDLPLLILDPNGDFVGLGSTLASADPADRRRLESAEVRVFRRRAGAGEHLLRSRFTALSTEVKAAVLELDPLVDRTEFNALLEMGERLATRPPEEVVDYLLQSQEPDERFLAQRIRNLGILEWDVWAGHDPSLLEGLEPRPRAAVVDLGGFDHPREPLVVALDLLESLWERRERREPVLLVIDEAHNICPSVPTDPLSEATTARVIQLANEGRKYGIWLLLCTQRPSRIHEAVLAQCDNLALMRMNSPGDLSQLERVFGFAPAEMLRSAPGFRQGECLMAGSFAPAPTFVQVRARRTREGGADVRVPHHQG